MFCAGVLAAAGWAAACSADDRGLGPLDEAAEGPALPRDRLATGSVDDAPTRGASPAGVAEAPPATTEGTPAPAAAGPAPGAPPAVPAVSAPAAAPALRIVRAKEIEADRVTAGVIHAKKIECGGGRVGQSEKPGDDRWEAETKGAAKLQQVELVADVIYAKEVKCGWIEAREIHAKEIEIGDD